MDLLLHHFPPGAARLSEHDDDGFCLFLKVDLLADPVLVFTVFVLADNADQRSWAHEFQKRREFLPQGDELSHRAFGCR